MIDLESPHTRVGTLRWPWILATWAAVSAALAWWLGTTPPGALREQLRHWQFWMLEGQFVLLVVLTWVNVRPLVRSLGLSLRDLLLPAFASILALALITGAAPRTNRIFFDEQIYQGIGQNLADLRLAQFCNDGDLEYGSLQCRRGEYNKEPYGYGYLLSVAYRVSGVSEDAAFALNTLAGTLLVWVVFLATTALAGDARAGGYGALVVALIPEQLRWSHTAAAEPVAALGCAVAVLAALAFARTRTTRELLWTVSATAFAAQLRPECLLIAVVVVAVILLRAPGEVLGPRFWWAGALGLVLLSLHAGHLVAVRHEDWGAAGARLSTAFFAGNLRTNGWFFLWDWRFPALYSALAVAGLALWRRRDALVPLLYFALFWGLFLFFYAGSYDYGADVRFSLMTYAPLAMLAGVGIQRVTARLPTSWRPRTGVPVLVVCALLFQFLWYLPYVRAVGEEAWAARADVAFARTFVADLPPNAIVLTQNPSMFHVWGHSAAQASLATTEPDYVRGLAASRYAGGVFFHWNYWCNVADPVQQGFCAAALAQFPHTLVREYRERDYRYAFYRLDVPAWDGPAPSAAP